MRSLSPRWRRVLRVLAACYLLYLVAANVLVNSALGPHLVNRRPEGFRMSWSWGATAWPGWIYLREPAMQGHARWTSWSIRGSWASGRIELLPLLHRRLVFATIHAGDVRVAMRRADSDRKPPPWSASAWTLVFHEVHTSTLREVHWHALDFEGDADADVGFSHQLRGGATQVFSSRLRTDGGHLSLGGQPLLEGLHVDLRGRIDPFLHDKPAGSGKLRLLHAHLALDAATPGLQPAATATPEAWLQDRAQAGAGGRLHVDLAMDDGVVQQGGALQWDVPLTVVEQDSTTRTVPMHARLEAAEDSLHLRLHASSPPGDPPRHAEVDLHYASRRLLDVPWRERLRRVDGRLQLHWHFASLDWLGPLIAKDWLQWHGDGVIDADLHLRHGVLQPGSRAELPTVNLRVRMFDDLLAGQAHATATVGGGDDPVTLTLAADRYTLAAAAQPDAVYLRGDDLAITLHSTAELARFAHEMHGRLRFHDARIPDLRSYNRYLPGDSVRILGGSGRSSADLTLGQGGVVVAGILHLDGQKLDLALGVKRLHTDLDMDARLEHAEKTAPRHYALSSFSLALNHVRMDDSDDRDWWAKATLLHGQLDWNEPFQLRGDARLQMKDASVLLSLFAKRHAFPAWIAHLVDVGRMVATAQLAVGRRTDGGRRFVLDDVRAHNRRVDLQARLRILDGKPEGVLYARWGILGLGVALKRDQRDFHLIDASDWYAAQPPLLSGTPPTP